MTIPLEGMVADRLAEPDGAPATRCDDEVDPARLCDLYRGLDEVAESAADEVVTALRASTIKGRKPTVRRERYEAR